MVSVLRALIGILKFVLLSYLYVVIISVRQLFGGASIIRRVAGGLGVLVLVGLPLYVIIGLYLPRMANVQLGVHQASVEAARVFAPVTAMPPQPAIPIPQVSAWTIAPEFALPRFPSSDHIERVTANAVNGDTIDVIGPNGVERIRLLGIDAPEDGMCFGAQAAARAQELLAGQLVTVEADPTQTDRDKFGRLYRYIRLTDGRLLNAVLVEEGYAYEYTYFTPYEYRTEFEQLEQLARADGRGIWSSAACSGSNERPDRVVRTITMMVPADAESARVVYVRDGDTVEVDVNGRIEPIRLIGIDTPELGRCFADAATERITALISGQIVWLEADSSQGERDRYDRLLRYIWMADGRMVNAILVQEGFAYEYTYRTLYAYEPVFMQLEHEAHFNGRGLWAVDTCNGMAGRRHNYDVYSDN